MHCGSAETVVARKLLAAMTKRSDVDIVIVVVWRGCVANERWILCLSLLLQVN